MDSNRDGLINWLKQCESGAIQKDGFGTQFLFLFSHNSQLLILVYIVMLCLLTLGGARENLAKAVLVKPYALQLDIKRRHSYHANMPNKIVGLVCSSGSQNIAQMKSQRKRNKCLEGGQHRVRRKSMKIT